jgi:hypothetical protein
MACRPRCRERQAGRAGFEETDWKQKRFCSDQGAPRCRFSLGWTITWRYWRYWRYSPGGQGCSVCLLPGEIKRIAEACLSLPSRGNEWATRTLLPSPFIGRRDGSRASVPHLGRCTVASESRARSSHAAAEGVGYPRRLPRLRGTIETLLGAGGAGDLKEFGIGERPVDGQTELPAAVQDFRYLVSGSL